MKETFIGLEFDLSAGGCENFKKLLNGDESIDTTQFFSEVVRIAIDNHLKVARFKRDGDKKVCIGSYFDGDYFDLNCEQGRNAFVDLETYFGRIFNANGMELVKPENIITLHFALDDAVYQQLKLKVPMMPEPKEYQLLKLEIPEECLFYEATGHANSILLARAMQLSLHLRDKMFLDTLGSKCQKEWHL